MIILILIIALCLTLVVFVKLLGAIGDLAASDAILPVMFAFIVGVAMMFAVVVITN